MEWVAVIVFIHLYVFQSSLNKIRYTERKLNFGRLKAE